MLRSMNDLKGYQIQATDGTIGHVKDFYFDDGWWTVRYLIVETGSWFSNRKVLISPFAIGTPNWTDKVLPVSMFIRSHELFTNASISAIRSGLVVK